MFENFDCKLWTVTYYTQRMTVVRASLNSLPRPFLWKSCYYPERACLDSSLWCSSWYSSAFNKLSQNLRLKTVAKTRKSQTREHWFLLPACKGVNLQKTGIPQVVSRGRKTFQNPVLNKCQLFKITACLRHWNSTTGAPEGRGSDNH